MEKISFLKYFHTVKKKDEINIKVVAEVGIISFLCVNLGYRILYSILLDHVSNC